MALNIKEIIYRQGRQPNKKNPDGYEYIINEKTFDTPDGARMYGNKLIDDYKRKLKKTETDSKKVRRFDPKAGTYKTYDTEDDMYQHLNRDKTTAVLDDDGTSKEFSTDKQFRAYVDKKDKAIQTKVDKASKVDPLAIQKKIEDYETAIEGLDSSQKTLRKRYVKKIAKLQAELEAFDKLDSPKLKLDY